MDEFALNIKNTFISVIGLRCSGTDKLSSSFPPVGAYIQML